MYPLVRQAFIIGTRQWFLPIVRQTSCLISTNGVSFAEEIVITSLDILNSLIADNTYRFDEEVEEVTELIASLVFNTLESVYGEEAEDEETPCDLGDFLTPNQIDTVILIICQLYHELCLVMDLSALLADTKITYLGHLGYDLRLCFEGHQPMLPAPARQFRMVRQSRLSYDGDESLSRSWM